MVCAAVDRATVEAAITSATRRTGTTRPRRDEPNHGTASTAPGINRFPSLASSHGRHAGRRDGSCPSRALPGGPPLPVRRERQPIIPATYRAGLHPAPRRLAHCRAVSVSGSRVVCGGGCRVVVLALCVSACAAETPVVRPPAPRQELPPPPPPADPDPRAAVAATDEQRQRPHRHAQSRRRASDHGRAPVRVRRMHRDEPAQPALGERCDSLRLQGERRRHGRGGARHRVDIGHRALEECLSAAVASTQFPKPAGAAAATFDWGMQVEPVGRPPDDLEPDVLKNVLKRHLREVHKNCQMRRRERFRITAYIAPGGRVLSSGAVPIRRARRKKSTACSSKSRAGACPRSTAARKSASSCGEDRAG